MDANYKIRWISISNIVVLISGLFVTLSCACSFRFARNNSRPTQLSHLFTMPDSFCFISATSCAFVCIVSAVLVLYFESLFIRNQFLKSAGGGFWITVAILAGFVVFISIMFTLACTAYNLHTRRVERSRMGGGRG